MDCKYGGDGPSQIDDDWVGPSCGPVGYLLKRYFCSGEWGHVLIPNPVEGRPGQGTEEKHGKESLAVAMAMFHFHFHLHVESPPQIGSSSKSKSGWRKKPYLYKPTNSIRIRAARTPDDYHDTLKALKTRGRTPRKSLGQHYVVNSSINEQLASVARVEDGDCVLEIGPGTGALTQVLLDAGATVLAVEKDPHMVIHVRDRFEGIDRLTVLEEDFTKCHIRSHLSPMLESGKSVRNDAKYAKVVSNIPFNISTDVVKQLLPLGDIFSEVVLLLQDETAVRLVDASLRTSEYRLINIFVNFYSDPEYKFKVPRTDFFPQPNVDAAVVTFKLRRPAEYPSVSSPKNFFSMVNSAFNGKRKMLRRSLQHIITPFEIERALENAGLPVTSRPEELTLDDFVRLHNLIAKV